MSEQNEDMLLTQEDFKDADTHTLGLFLDTPKEILEAQVAKAKLIHLGKGWIRPAEANNLVRKLFKDFAMEKYKAVEEAKRQERERIQKEYEGEWCLVTDTYCPEWVLRFRQALKGE